jgi:hypothetical protein
VGRSQSPLTFSLGQPLGSRRWNPCCRRCLLKGCERWFLPRHPRARYCGPDCQKAAQRWRRWHASQRYRATTNGKQHRRDQSRRYRSRARQSLLLPEPVPPTLEVEPLTPMVDAEPTLPPAPPTAVIPDCEGQRPAEILKQFLGRPCDRPGCYVLFRLAPRSPQQAFCSCSCRQALRRVRQREERLKQRRRLGCRPQRRLHRGPPKSGSLMSSRIEKPRC